MSEEKRTFSVKDRRTFTAEGEVRAQSDEPAPADAPVSQAAAPPEPEPEPPGDPEAAEMEGGGDESLPVDLAGFLMSLAAQGMQALMQQPPRLREARALVSILEMLEDKTRGRRTAEESDVLDTLLYQLRMGYLERQRAGGA